MALGSSRILRWQALAVGCAVALSLVTLAMIWFGIGEASKVFLITYVTVFIVTINTMAGVASIPAAKLRAGRRVVGVSFVADAWSPEGIIQPQVGVSLNRNEIPDGNPAVASVAISGPFAATGPGASALRGGVLTCAAALAYTVRAAS